MAAPLQHWMVSCTTCDGPAENHCNTCGDILCSRCKEIHQGSNASGHHEVVPYSERVEPSKLQGQCKDHPGHGYLFWCEKCDKTVCGECVTSEYHEGHKLTKVAAKIDEKRNVVKADFGRYSDLLVQWEKSLQELQTERSNFEMGYNELDKEITSQTDEICSQVRRHEAATRKHLHDTKPSKTSLFQEQENALKNGIRDIKQHAEEVEGKLRSEDMDFILNYTARADRMAKPPKKNVPQLPTFKPGKPDDESIHKMFGSLSLGEQEKDVGENIPEAERSEPKAPYKTQDSASKKTPDQTLGVPSNKMKMMHLLPTATVESIIETFTLFRAPSITCTDAGQTWVRTTDRTLQLMDSTGTVKQTVNIEFDMAHMTITPQGDLLVTDLNNKCIKSILKEGISQTLFTTKLIPKGICILQNGDVVVSFHDERRVIQYSSTGKVVRELDKSLFGNPGSVAQNKTNQHIYVSDESAVLAFDMKGRLQFKYTGTDSTGVDPAGVCTDQAGHVIITDCRNHRVNILNKDGRFLKYILTKDQGLNYPWTIDTDNDGYVWIGEYEYSLSGLSNGRVKICKYMYKT